MSGVTAAAIRSVCLAASICALACDGKLVTLGNAPVVGNGGTEGGALGVGGDMNAGGAVSGEAGAIQGGVGGTQGGSGGTGAGAPGTPRFSDVRRMTALGSDAKDENPTFTEDLLHVFFSTTREDGDSNIWTASRTSRDGIFGNLQRVEAVSTTETDTSPAISADGLTLWVGQTREGGLGGFDIWMVTRESLGSEWSTPENVFELNSAFDDIPRPTSLGNTVMPLGSRREGKYRTYIAVRPDPTASFGAAEPLDELVFADGSNTVDGFLSSDGRILFFSSTLEEDKSDLYYAHRLPGEAFEFGPPIPIADLNTVEFDERDPFLSSEGDRFFFVSNRTGNYEIFETTVTRE